MVCVPLISSYSDSGPFIDTLIESMKNAKSNGGWKILYAGRMLDEMWEQDPQTRNENRAGRRLSVWLKNRTDKEVVWEYANTYLRQEDPFPIIQDAKSDAVQLREAAWRALENIRHPLVREFALEQMQEDSEAALPVLVVNYEAQDEKMLVDYVKSIKIDFKCTTSWHSVHLDILGMIDYGLKAPTSLLQSIFENTYCSCCREYALRQMGKRRLVTKEILEECLYDSNEEIRVYAKRRLK